MNKKIMSVVFSFAMLASLTAGMSLNCSAAYDYNGNYHSYTNSTTNYYSDPRSHFGWGGNAESFAIKNYSGATWGFLRCNYEKNVWPFKDVAMEETKWNGVSVYADGKVWTSAASKTVGTKLLGDGQRGVHTPFLNVWSSAPSVTYRGNIYW